MLARSERLIRQQVRPDGPRVDYRVDNGRLLREERDGKDVRRRESYDVARLLPLTFEVDGPLVRLALSRRTSNPFAPARPVFRIEADLGKDPDALSDAG